LFRYKEEEEKERNVGLQLVGFISKESRLYFKIGVPKEIRGNLLYTTRGQISHTDNSGSK
jgi:hypothetical protein